MGSTDRTLSSPPSTPRSAEQIFMHRLLGDLKAHPSAWAFLNPVNGEEVIDYYEVIKRPMGRCFTVCHGVAYLLRPRRFQYDGAQTQDEPVPQPQGVRG